MSDVEFHEFPKIARLSRKVIITEKIDGTNASIYIDKETDEFLVGSRNRWITLENDNHRFAKWAFEHELELRRLGAGHHFGEWWGSGIQRGYGLKKGDKRFSLFNTVRWCLHNQTPQRIETGDPRQEKFQERLPECCSLVPVLWEGEFNTEAVEMCLWDLKSLGSLAVPGFMNPEGVVVYHTAGNVAFKKTLGNDGHKLEKEK
jgi:hypothetical protein